MTNSTITKLGDFQAGANYVFLGFKDIFHPKVRHFIYVPIIINLIIFSVIFYYGAQYAYHKLSFLSPTLPSWLHWLSGFLTFIKNTLLFFIFTLSIGIITLASTLCANLIAAPFNGLLSEAFSKALNATLPNRSLGQTISQTISRELVKFLYYLPRAILLGIVAVILYFLPPVNLIIPVLFYWFSAWMMAIQYIDYPADNFHINFSTTMKKLKERRMLCLGFGLTVTLLSSIPFVNFIVMPAAVISATRLWHEKLI